MNDDIERTLRASLAEHARQAPDGDALARRIIAEADHPRPARRTARWRAWSLPLVAAGSVAAVVAAVVGVTQLHHPGAHPAATRPAVSAPPSTASTPAPSRLNVPVPPSSASLTAVPTQPPATSGPVPNAFRVVDLTFVGADTGWALGSGQCFKDPANRCTALLRTTDGGANWESIQNPAANVPIGGRCAAPCVEHIRFGSDRVGYAFGPDVLLMTTDGAHNWTPQPGGATSLEVANGTVLRTLASGALQKSDAGTASWSGVALPGGAAVGDVMRALDRAFVRAPSGAIYASADDGATWVDRGDPCRRAGQSGKSRLAVGADGSITVLCSGPAGDGTVVTSTNGGATFSAPTAVPFDASVAAFGAADGSTLFYASDALYRSTDHGGTWQRVTVDPTTGTVAFLGFETPATGRWVTGDGSAVWTTTDGGASWHGHPFS